MTDKNKKLIICKVNNIEIEYRSLKEAYQVELDNYYSEFPDNQLSEEELKELKLDTLYSLIYELLILDKAKSENLIITEDEIDEEKKEFKDKFGNEMNFDIVMDDNELSKDDFEDFIKNDLLIKKMLKKDIEQEIQITDEMVKQYYETNKKHLIPKKMYQLRQITLNKEGYEEYSEVILKKINRGVDFGELAKMYSEDSFSENEGLLDPLPLESFYEEIQNQIKDLKEGESTEFIDFNDKYFLYKIEKIHDEKEKPFNKIKDELKNVLHSQIYQDLFYQYVEGLMEQSSIEFNEDITNEFLS